MPYPLEMVKRGAGAWVTLSALMAAAAAALGAPTAAPSVRASDGPQLPNIAPRPAAEVRIGPADGGTGTAIRFSSWMANNGAHHFDIAGVPTSTTPLTATANQCIEWAAPRVCGARQEIGTLTYHAAHAHYHFVDFARYELRTATTGSLAALSDKVSFCMQDSAPVRSGRPLETAFAFPLYFGCDIGTQGISAGWADIYTSELAGQQILLAGVPDGVYDLVTVADPSNRILETDESDNTSVRRVRISGGGTQLTVLA